MSSDNSPNNWIATILIVVSSLALTSEASAQIGPTEIVGGPGGAPIYDHCPDGEFLTGINYVISGDLTNEGKNQDMVAVAAVCTTFSGNRAIGTEHALRVWGDPNVKSRYDSYVKCPLSKAAEQVSVKVKDSLVNAFALTCRSIDAHDYQSTGYGTGYSPPANARTARCGGGALAVGIVGRYGTQVVGLGLLCKTMAVAPAPPPVDTAPSPTPPPIENKPAQPPLTVDNSDNGDEGGPTAANDTTIYDQPEGNDIAYLQAGDAVTIVSCEADNWCKISKPKKGWVWGGDLNR